MDGIRDSYSRLKKKFKHKLMGSKPKPDRTELDAHGERVGSSGSLPRPEPHVVAGGHDQGRNVADMDGQQVCSADLLPQQDEPGPAPARGSRDERGTETDVDGREASQRYSQVHPDVEAAMGSGRGGEIECIRPSPSTPSIPHSGKSGRR